MGVARYIHLTQEEDAQLRTLEQAQGLDKKVRLRASIVRLSHAGWSVARLAQHFGRGNKTIHQDFERWEGQKIAGLADGRAPGNPSKVTAEMSAYLGVCLSEERAWNCEQLSRALQERFEVEVKREAIRTKLMALGYSWQRARYEPGKEVDPEVLREAKASIETLKRGHWTNN
jgi:transposase